MILRGLAYGSALFYSKCGICHAPLTLDGKGFILETAGGEIGSERQYLTVRYLYLHIDTVSSYILLGGFIYYHNHTSTMNSNHIYGPEISLKQWTIAIIIGLIVEGLIPVQFVEFLGGYASASVHTYLPESMKEFLAQSHIDNYIYFAVSAVRDGTVSGICIGFAQWYILRGVVSWAKPWIFVSIVGGIINGLIVVGINLLISPWSRSIMANYSIQGILAGVTIGIAQWWILRQHVSMASSWVLANIVSWLVGSVVGLIVGVFAALIVGTLLGGLLAWLTGIEETFVYVFYFVGHLTGLISGGIIGGIITGITLEWLLRRPREVSVSTEVIVS